MTPVPSQPGAALVLGLRGPLARIELLASRLARSATTPAEREIGESISAAVSELDGIIGRVLELFAPPASAADPVAPVGPVLDEVVDRVAPALEARGLACERDRAGDGTCAGTATARRAAIELLDRVCRELAPGSVVRLGAEPRAGGAALVLAVRPEGEGGGEPGVLPGAVAGWAGLRAAPGPVFELLLPGGAGGCTAS